MNEPTVENLLKLFNDHFTSYNLKRNLTDFVADFSDGRLEWKLKKIPFELDVINDELYYLNYTIILKFVIDNKSYYLQFDYIEPIQGHYQGYSDPYLVEPREVLVTKFFRV